LIGFITSAPSTTTSAVVSATATALYTTASAVVSATALYTTTSAVVGPGYCHLASATNKTSDFDHFWLEKYILNKAKVFKIK